MPRKIKAIIFDLGQVIIPLNVQRMAQHFNQLGAKNAEAKFQQEDIQALWKSYDNNLDTPTFRSQLKEKLDLYTTVTDEQFDEAWSAMFDEPPIDRISTLQELKKQGIRLFLSSNTNPIHLLYLKKIYGNTFDDCFEKQYYSNETTVAKPSAISYTQILDEQKLDPDETLFFDDKLENVRGAEAVGIHAKQFTVDMPMTTVIDEMNRINRIASYQTKSILSWQFFSGAAVTAAIAIGTLLWWKTTGNNTPTNRLK